MSIIYLKDDVNSFVGEITREVETNDVLVSMYGYKAIVYKGSNPTNVRIGIQKKLKAIKNHETNLDMIRRYSGMPEEQINFIESKYTPDEVADLCFDLGLISTCQKII